MTDCVVLPATVLCVHKQPISCLPVAALLLILACNFKPSQCAGLHSIFFASGGKSGKVGIKSGQSIHKSIKPNIHDAIWSHTIYKSQCVHYKIVQSYVAYDMSYRIELLFIPYDMTKSYATISQCVYWA